MRHDRAIDQHIIPPETDGIVCTGGQLFHPPRGGRLLWGDPVEGIADPLRGGALHQIPARQDGTRAELLTHVPPGGERHADVVVTNGVSFLQTDQCI
jgi:hypothetical protein